MNKLKIFLFIIILLEVNFSYGVSPTSKATNKVSPMENGVSPASKATDKASSMEHRTPHRENTKSARCRLFPSDFEGSQYTEQDVGAIIESHETRFYSQESGWKCGYPNCKKNVLSFESLCSHLVNKHLFFLQLLDFQDKKTSGVDPPSKRVALSTSSQELEIEPAQSSSLHSAVGLPSHTSTPKTKTSDDIMADLSLRKLSIRTEKLPEKLPEKRKGEANHVRHKIIHFR